MSSDKPLVSIIIPVISINDYIRESVPKILQLTNRDFEILIVTDKAENRIKFSGTRFVVSGKVGPAVKRDLAAKNAKGSILAFLDDDAYPDKKWLRTALIHFHNPKIAAVGGPAITPTGDSIWQKISGAIFESYIGGSNARDRYLSIGKPKFTDDWPTVNLLVRKRIFRKLGGFDNNFWPGEDTKLCLDIINAGYKIIYEPQAVVYHHRRSNIVHHFQQIGNYGLHRGYFAKKYPQTSLRFWYFVPTFFDLYLLTVIVWLSFRPGPWLAIYCIPLSIYILGLIFDGIIIAFRWKNPVIGILTVPMIFLTHIWYGIRFVWGLILPKLDK